MHELTQLIKEDMRPALGVTEPGAIAYAVSKAKSFVPGAIENVTLLLNSGIIFTEMNMRQLWVQLQETLKKNWRVLQM